MKPTPPPSDPTRGEPAAGVFRALLERLPLEVQIHRLDEGALSLVYAHDGRVAPPEGERPAALDEAAAARMALVASTGEGCDLGVSEVERPGGGLAHAHARLIPLPDGHVARVVEEVSEPAPVDGWEQGERWRAVFLTSRTAMCIGDERGHLKIVNPAFEALYGYGRGQMVGMNIAALFTEAERDQVPAIGAITARDGWHRFETTHMKRGGDPLPVLVELTALSGLPEGQGQRFASVHDISELVKAREALQRQSEALERANNDLRRSNVELQRFAYIASHDLQEPLRAVSSFCQLLERDYKGQFDERGESWLGFVIDGADRMRQLIEDLLAFSRLEGRLLKRESVDLGRVVKQAMLLLKEPIAGREAGIIVGELPTLVGDSTLLLQLMQNLISNAVKFSPEGFVIHIDAERVEGAWRVSVRDQGIGIKAQFHEEIFDIFKRLEPRRKYTGTGIGLAICRKVVERFGGRIWVESERGAGSAFLFELPDLDPTEAQRASP